MMKKRASHHLVICTLIDTLRFRLSSRKAISMNAFNKLVKHSKKISNFNHLSSIVGWDQAAVMPSGGAEARS
ncbi:carboxypeptidase M32, partial [Vibrio cholerae]